MKILAISLGIIFLVLALSLYIPFPPELLQPASVDSLRILDRNGYLLREVLSDKEGKSQWVSLQDISPNLILATVAAEDSRFYEHWGVDTRAILRAILQNIRARKVVSGASTLTQQAIKGIYHFPRNWFWKLVEVWYA